MFVKENPDRKKNVAEIRLNVCGRVSKMRNVSIYRPAVSNEAILQSRTEYLKKNSSFHVKERTTRKVQFQLSRSCLLVLTRFCFLGGRLDIRL